MNKEEANNVLDGQPVLLTDRWEKILDLVHANNGATMKELCAHVGMSPNTARRDLEALQKRGLILRTHGRILPCTSHAKHTKLTLAESRTVNAELKTAVGRAAAGLIGRHETVLIDGGFTTAQVAEHIDLEELHVVTNSLDVANILAPRHGIDLILIGGDLWRDTGSMIGLFALDQVNRINADKAILGIDAISAMEGVSCFNSEMALMKRAMTSRSKQLIAVADHTKIGKFCKYTWADLAKVTTLVTDSLVDPQLLAMLRSSGVNVVVAQV